MATTTAVHIPRTTAAGNSRAGTTIFWLISATAVVSSMLVCCLPEIAGAPHVMRMHAYSALLAKAC
eukprot:3485874-Pleurochrysis_carterae.AAC.3